MGRVLDSSGLRPVSYVSVLSTKNIGAITDSSGTYRLSVSPNDSIWFSYLNKPSQKFAVRDIPNPNSFDISLPVSIITLPIVETRPRNYRQDSIQNRADYAKIFEYEKPKFSNTVEGILVFDLERSIEIAFRRKYTKRMLAFQGRLINEEQEKFVRHRFSKALIRKLTQLTEDSLISNFITDYLPSYEFTRSANDYDFHNYIRQSYKKFMKHEKPDLLWRNGMFDD